MFLGRVVADGEPLWLPADRRWALALLEVEADTCPGCGQPLSQSTDRENEGAYDATFLACHGCRAAAMRTTAHQDGNGDTRGLFLQVKHMGGRH